MELITEDTAKRIAILEERIAAQDLMMAQTTSYMNSIQQKLEKSKKELERKNKEIIDSLIYAKRLQQSSLPSPELWEECFTDSFCHLSQSQIIGGDFCFLVKYNEYIIVGVFDCTGHGIPGAMLSMMGTSLLNEIITIKKVRSAGHILKELNQLFKEQFRNRSLGVNDGMDGAVCVIDKKGRLNYAGAKRPLWLLPKSSNFIQVYKPDPVSIGERSLKAAFKETYINLKKGDRFYLFSDGVTDQFGGDKNKKFSRKRLQKLIEDIGDLKMTTQYQILAKNLKSWQGELDQTDDQLMIGIKY